MTIWIFFFIQNYYVWIVFGLNFCNHPSLSFQMSHVLRFFDRIANLSFQPYPQNVLCTEYCKKTFKLGLIINWCIFNVKPLYQKGTSLIKFLIFDNFWYMFLSPFRHEKLIFFEKSQLDLSFITYPLENKTHSKISSKNFVEIFNRVYYS